MLEEEVLALLRGHGEGHLSGEAMSRTLAVSRAAVWKAVEALRRDGYQITSAPNRGYRLAGGPDRIRAGELAGALAGRTVGRELVCLETVDSTNTEVKRRAAAGAAEGLAVLAEGQTAGRGRRGRSFQSLSGKGLYLSVLLRPAVSLAELSQLTAWTAVAVCRGIQSCCGAEPQIKWTNDILLNGKKLCGVLTELELEAESAAPSHVVVGLGVNVSQTAADFGPELADIATSLELEGFSVRRAELAGQILAALDDLYAAFPAGKADYLSDYRARCATTGREVLLLRGDAQVPAFAEALPEHRPVFVEAGVAGGLLAAPADGLDLLDDVRRGQQLLRAREELAGKVRPQAVADHRHVPIVHHADQILHLVPAEKLRLVHNDAGIGPHLLLRHDHQLGKIDARMGQSHPGGHELGPVPLVDLRLDQQGHLPPFLIIIAHHQGVGRLAGPHNAIPKV